MKVAKMRGRDPCRGRMWKADVMVVVVVRGAWDEKWEEKKTGGMENDSRGGM